MPPPKRLLTGKYAPLLESGAIGRQRVRTFRKRQRYQLYGVVLFVWIVILTWSPIRLSHFLFGPLEWAWRSLTHWKRQPFRVRERVVA